MSTNCNKLSVLKSNWMMNTTRLKNSHNYSYKSLVIPPESKRTFTSSPLCCIQLGRALGEDKGKGSTGDKGKGSTGDKGKGSTEDKGKGSTDGKGSIGLTNPEPLIKAFEAADKNKDKVLTKDEFKEALKTFMTNYTTEQTINAVFDNYVKAGFKDVTEMHFITMGREIQRLVSLVNIRILHLFQDYAPGKFKLNKDQLTKLVEDHFTLTVGKDKAKVKELVDSMMKFDKDKDGVIDLHEARDWYFKSTDHTAFYSSVFTDLTGLTPTSMGIH